MGRVRQKDFLGEVCTVLVCGIDFGGLLNDRLDWRQLYLWNRKLVNISHFSVKCVDNVNKFN